MMGDIPSLLDMDIGTIVAGSALGVSNGGKDSCHKIAGEFLYVDVGIRGVRNERGFVAQGGDNSIFKRIHSLIKGFRIFRKKSFGKDAPDDFHKGDLNGGLIGAVTVHIHVDSPISETKTIG